MIVFLSHYSFAPPHPQNDMILHFYINIFLYSVVTTAKAIQLHLSQVCFISSLCSGSQIYSIQLHLYQGQRAARQVIYGRLVQQHLVLVVNHLAGEGGGSWFVSYAGDTRGCCPPTHRYGNPSDTSAPACCQATSCALTQTPYGCDWPGIFCFGTTLSTPLAPGHSSSACHPPWSLLPGTLHGQDRLPGRCWRSD